MNILLLVVTTFSLQAEIIEIKRFCECLEHIRPDTLVLVDIDNTVLEPSNSQQVGSDQWFTQLFRQSNDPRKAIDQYCSTVLEIDMQLVEPSVRSVFEQLLDHVTLLGFTMRSLILAPRTVAELHRNGICYTPCFTDGGFMVDGQYPVMMYQDILFCQGEKNGNALFTVLDAYDFKPAAIVMIDDKRRYLEDVERACQMRGIPFIGLRYGYLDQKVTQFLHGVC